MSGTVFPECQSQSYGASERIGGSTLHAPWTFRWPRSADLEVMGCVFIVYTEDKIIDVP